MIDAVAGAADQPPAEQVAALFGPIKYGILPDHLARAHDEDPAGEHCKGMEGLVAEARKHALEADFGDDEVQDAAIIAQYQRLAHYAITGYGTLKAWAKRLDLAEDAKVLDECTASTYEGDEDMTKIAVKGGVNKAAL